MPHHFGQVPLNFKVGENTLLYQGHHLVLDRVTRGASEEDVGLEHHLQLGFLHFSTFRFCHHIVENVLPTAEYESRWTSPSILLLYSALEGKYLREVFCHLDTTILAMKKGVPTQSERPGSATTFFRSSTFRPCRRLGRRDHRRRLRLT